jgi:hypothetical protein
MLTLDQQIDVAPYKFDPNSQFLASMVLEADFLMKKRSENYQQINKTD